MIRQAPASFAAAVAAAAIMIGIITWLYASAQYADALAARDQRIESLKEDISRRDAVITDYRTQYSGLSPETKPAARKLTEAQARVLIAAMQVVGKNKSVQIIAANDPDSYQYAKQWKRVFGDAGWSTDAMVASYPFRGVSIEVLADEDGSGHRIEDAMSRAEVEVTTTITLAMPESAQKHAAILRVGAREVTPLDEH